MKRDTRIPRSPGPIAVEDYQGAEESSYSISPWSPQGVSLSQTPIRPMPLRTIWKLSFNR